jgi:hypothetical protein
VVPSQVGAPYGPQVHLPVTVPVDPVITLVLPAWSWCRYDTVPPLLICSIGSPRGPYTQTNLSRLPRCDIR